MSAALLALLLCGCGLVTEMGELAQTMRDQAEEYSGLRQQIADLIPSSMKNNPVAIMENATTDPATGRVELAVTISFLSFDETTTDEKAALEQLKELTERILSKVDENITDIYYFGYSIPHRNYTASLNYSVAEDRYEITEMSGRDIESIPELAEGGGASQSEKE